MRLRSTTLDDWRFSEKDKHEWRAAVVPGHVHCDLMRHGVIADPFVGENEKACQWVDECDWSYRCSFSWNADNSLPHRVLRFEGLDTVCSVWVNGSWVAEHDTMFVPMEIDVSSLLVSGVNEVRVEFLSAARVGRERKAKYFAEQGLAEDTPNFDERAFVRKAQYMFGWDWGPRLVSCGIWRPVYLVESDASDKNAETSIPQPLPPLPRTNIGDTRGRGVSLVQKPEVDGASFEFFVDGKPFYALGANWIPDHSFPSQIPRERYRERLQQAKDLGINMLRVWGGGIYEDDAFYELCDELRILVWQDFMFACSYYPDLEAWQEGIREEAESQICRLRRHPCIAIWCGNNECHQVWQDGWGGKDKQPSRFHGEVLYHEILRHAVERLDPGRPYWPGSPFGSGYCNSGKDGDQHYWDVWHGRGDWTYYKESDARFCSEFGFMSSPSAATWSRTGVQVSAPKLDVIARAHNKTGKPFEIIESLVELHYPHAESLDEWSYYTQLNQRDALRAAIEHFRFSGRCRGALLWQLNDCWPVESWSVLEFEGRKKAAAFELSRLFAPLLLRIQEEGGEAVLSACLQNASSGVAGEAMVQAIDLLSAEVIGEKRVHVELQPESMLECLRMPIPAGRQVLWKGLLGGAEVLYRTAKPGGWRLTDKYSCRQDKGSLVLEPKENLIDVRLADIEQPANTFEPNFFSLVAGGRMEIRSSMPVSKLEVRCLNFSPPA